MFRGVVGVVDHGVGNYISIINLLNKIGVRSKRIRNVLEINSLNPNVDKMIIPGVGSFDSGMLALKSLNIFEGIRKFSGEGGGILGICLGMQLFFEKSFENNIQTKGLNFIEGVVEKLIVNNCEKIPHTGWNNLIQVKNDIILENVNLNADFYFTHSFYCNVRNENEIIAFTDYGHKFPSLIKKDNIFGCQFHPEKSSDNGIKILKNFSNFN